MLNLDIYTATGSARVDGAHVAVEEELVPCTNPVAPWEDTNVEQRGQGAEWHGGSDPSCLSGEAKRCGYQQAFTSGGAVLAWQSAFTDSLLDRPMPGLGDTCARGGA